MVITISPLCRSVDGSAYFFTTQRSGVAEMETHFVGANIPKRDPFRRLLRHLKAIIFLQAMAVFLLLVRLFQ